MAETLVLVNDAVRDKARDWIKRAPEGSKVTFSRPKRTSEQSRLFWSLCGQLSSKAKYHGYTLSKDDWRTLMVSGIRKEMRIVPSLNNDGIVALDRSSANLTVAEMAACIELIEAWAATNGVDLVRTMEGYE